MTIQVGNLLLDELTKSRRGRSSGDAHAERTLYYSVRGTTLGDVAAVTAFEHAPLWFIDPFNLVPLFKWEATWDPTSGSFGNAYEIGIVYKDPVQTDRNRQLQAGEFRISKDASGGSLHITHSLETFSRHTAASSPIECPDFGHALNATCEGEIQGVDVSSPVCKIQIDFRFPAGIINMPYLTMLDTMVCTTNDGWFLDCDEGELLFAAYKASQAFSLQNVTGPQITFDFLKVPNLVDQDIADIHVAAKKGHYYVWIYSHRVPGKSPTGDPLPILIKRPQFACVERVYRTSDFAALGTGLENPVPAWEAPDDDSLTPP